MNDHENKEINTMKKSKRDEIQNNEVSHIIHQHRRQNGRKATPKRGPRNKEKHESIKA